MTTWQASWGQALPDVRADAEVFGDVTLRTRLRVGIGGDRVRLEFGNQFGDEALVIGRMAVGGVVCAGLTVPAGESAWTEPVDLRLADHAALEVDVYLPGRTSFPPLFAAAGDFTCRMSAPGDHVGADDFPAVPAPPFPMPDDADIPVHECGPFLRTVEVSGRTAGAVVVCLGDSITAMGWPERSAGLLDVPVVNRGIPGNRLRLDAGAANLPNGRAGLGRFADDVLGTAGVTDVVIALGTNDLGLPGEFEPLGELPTAGQLIDAYRTLLDQARAAGVRARVATITPRAGSDGHDDERERIREAVNDWIRTLGSDAVDFDLALRSATAPRRLDDRYDSGDHLHPGDAGQEQLARTFNALMTVRRREDHNRAVVTGFYAAMTRAERRGGFTPGDLAAVVDFFENEREVEINLGAPIGGTFRGPDEIAVGRHRMHELCGFTHRDHSRDETFADGPDRVVCVGVNHGEDAAGNPWSMTTIELIDLEDGRVIRKRVFFQDADLLTRIAREREALLHSRLADRYWETDNPLIALRGAASA